MAADGLTDGQIRDVLTATKRIAVVGASNRPDRPSYGVMRSLIARGYEVIPVNPGLAGQQIHGRTVVPSLEAAGTLDMVDVFRASAHVAPVVDEAVRLGAKTIWLQIGVSDAAAEARARAAGMMVVVDRCPKIEFARLGMPASAAG